MGGGGGVGRIGRGGGSGEITARTLPPGVLAIGLDILTPKTVAVGCDGGGTAAVSVG